MQASVNPRVTKLHKTRRKVSGGDRTDGVTAAQSCRAGPGAPRPRSLRPTCSTHGVRRRKGAATPEALSSRQEWVLHHLRTSGRWRTSRAVLEIARTAHQVLSQSVMRSCKEHNPKKMVCRVIAAIAIIVTLLAAPAQVKDASFGHTSPFHAYLQMCGMTRLDMRDGAWSLCVHTERMMCACVCGIHTCVCMYISCTHTHPPYLLYT